MESVRKHRRNKVVITEKRRNYLVSKLSLNKVFLKKLTAIEMNKTKIFMNKPVCLGLAILEINELVMHDFQFDYVKSKYKKNAKLYYMDTNSFIAHVKTEDIYKDIAKDVEGKIGTNLYDNKIPKEGSQKKFPKNSIYCRKK